MQVNSKKEKVKNMNKTESKRVRNSIKMAIFAFCLLPFAFASAQAQEPKPGTAKAITVPTVKEKNLPNGLTVVVVERKNLPLVSVQMSLGSGVTMDDIETAGLANMTVSLLTKGTKTRSATQIAEQIEFLGGSLSNDVRLDNSNVTLNITSDKLDAAMAIMAETILNPAFSPKEIEIFRSQALDELNSNLQDPGFLASYVSSVFSFYTTPASGTPDSLKAITQEEITQFYRENYYPERSTLIFVGDINANKAFLLAQKLFGKWKKPKSSNKKITITSGTETKEIDSIKITESRESFEKRKSVEAQQPLLKRMLVIDLPDSGQASVSFNNSMQFAGRIVYNDEKNRGEFSQHFFPAIVMNSIFGGGYSSRLNQEIRIKRGLTYGAGSGITWRAYDSRFSARTQTKNITAAEVAELILAELEKIGTSDIQANELTARKEVLTGDFGRDLETNEGLMETISEFYSDWLPASEFNFYMKNIRAVTKKQVQQFATENLRGGDIIIVGDYAVFKDDLAKRFPNVQVQVIKASDVDLKKMDEVNNQ